MWSTGGFNQGADGSAVEVAASLAFAPYPQPGADFDESYLHHEWSAWGPWDAEAYAWPELEVEAPGSSGGAFEDPVAETAWLVVMAGIAGEFQIIVGRQKCLKSF